MNRLNKSLERLLVKRIEGSLVERYRLAGNWKDWKVGS